MARAASTSATAPTPGFTTSSPTLDEIDARAVNSIAIPGSDAVVRVGRYGPYLRTESASEPAAGPRPRRADAGEGARSSSRSPTTGRSAPTRRAAREIVVRSGRYGPYVTEVLPDGADEKPRTASLFSSMSPETVTLEDALRLLSLPRVVGELDGEEVTAQNGTLRPVHQAAAPSRARSRARSSSSRSRSTRPRRSSQSHRGAAATAPRARPAQGARRGSGERQARRLRDGRFGPYVTDGETNASLRRGDTPDAITLERAVELLAERRAKSE